MQFGTAEFEELQAVGYRFEYLENGEWKIGNAETYEECQMLKSNYEESYDCNPNEDLVKVKKNLYWRIIRINGDGTIRILFDGAQKIKNGSKKTTASIITSVFNFKPQTNDIKYFGYTYNDGFEEIDSNAKKVIDNWYESNLKNKYGKYIADGIFCNDITVSKYMKYDENSNLVEVPFEEGYDMIFYSSYDQTPTLKCNRREYKYTIDSKKGNGLLDNPIGLLSANEAKLVGNKYLYTGYDIFTMSACMWKESSTFMCGINGSINGEITEHYSAFEGSIRPVINLKANVNFVGNGTIEEPYVIITD